MSRFHHKGAANQLRRPRYAVMNLLRSWIGPGIISGFYDITQDGGALKQDGSPIARVENEEIWSMPNLLAPDGGTGNALIFTWAGAPESPSSPRNNLFYRKNIKLNNGLLSNPRIPFAYYPLNFVDSIWQQTQTNTGPDNELIQQITTMAYLEDGTIAPTDFLPETFEGITYGIFGCQAIYESQMFVDAMSQALVGGLDALMSFPAPVMPNSVIYESKLITVGGTLHVRVRIWIANVLMQDNTEQVLLGDVPVTSPSELTADKMFGQVGMLMGLFCFATQKLFYINKILTDNEREELHNALIGTSEYYGHG